MPLYEHVFLTRQDASNQQVDALTEQFKAVIAGLGGTVKKNEYWGVKSLSFRIKKNRKAHYTLLNLDAPPAAIAEMERQMSINEDIIRYMTVRVEELEDGPSAMMRSGRDRGERGERGGFGDGGGFGGGRGFGGDRADRGDRGDRGFGGGRPRRDAAPETAATGEAV